MSDQAKRLHVQSAQASRANNLPATTFGVRIQGAKICYRSLDRDKWQTLNRNSLERSVCITGSSSSHKFVEVHVLETATFT